MIVVTRPTVREPSFALLGCFMRSFYNAQERQVKNVLGQAWACMDAPGRLKTSDKMDSQAA